MPSFLPWPRPTAISHLHTSTPPRLHLLPSRYSPSLNPIVIVFLVPPHNVYPCSTPFKFRVFPSHPLLFESRQDKSRGSRLAAVGPQPTIHHVFIFLWLVMIGGFVSSEVSLFCIVMYKNSSTTKLLRGRPKRWRKCSLLPGFSISLEAVFSTVLEDVVKRRKRCLGNNTQTLSNYSYHYNRIQLTKQSWFSSGSACTLTLSDKTVWGKRLCAISFSSVSMRC